jgi:hypothetical protein
MLPLPPSKRAAGRRLAEALLDPLVRGVRAMRGGAPDAPEAAESPAAVGPAPAPVAEAAPAGPTPDEAAARIDAARARLRARIAPPAADDPLPPA